MTQVDPVRNYDDLLADGRRLYPSVRIGRPGRSRAYWPTVAALRVARVLYAVDAKGLERVADGPAILVGNHSGALDPVFVVASTWWRVSAFTKIEAFEGGAAAFFRLMGQIPLRRGAGILCRQPAANPDALREGCHRGDVVASL